MRLLNLDPITDESVPDLPDYIGRYLSPGTQLLSWRIPTGPASIESEYDEVFAAPEVVRLCQKAEAEGIDGVFVNCFGDPGVRAARAVVNIPVVGGFEPVMHLTMGLADRIGIITVMPSVLPLIHGNVARHGLDRRVVAVKSVDIPVHDLQDMERVIPALAEESLRCIREGGAEAIVLGCTAMADVAEEVKRRLSAQGYDVPVAEAAQSALAVLELQVRMKLLQSRITYPLHNHN